MSPHFAESISALRCTVAAGGLLVLQKAHAPTTCNQSCGDTAARVSTQLALDRNGGAAGGGSVEGALKVFGSAEAASAAADVLTWGDIPLEAVWRCRCGGCYVGCYNVNSCRPLTTPRA